MSNGIFLLALTAGAALLAMWLHVRFPSLTPGRMTSSLFHVGAAFALLKLSALYGAGSLTVFGTVVLLLLPALVYALLCTIWILKHAQAAMGVSR
jgi:hypothetical protein